jgi:hypothetical protein
MFATVNIKSAWPMFISYLAAILGGWLIVLGVIVWLWRNAL